MKPTKSKLLLLKSQRKRPELQKNIVIYVEDFKSNQFTFEIGPKGPKRTKSRTHGGKKVVWCGVLVCVCVGVCVSWCVGVLV